jgi:hypothetical protein
VRRASQGLYAVAGLEGSGFAEALDNANHALPVEHAGDEVGDGGRSLTLTDRRQIAKDREHQFPAYGRESVAVEE